MPFTAAALPQPQTEAQSAPDKSDPRWRKLSEVTEMISEWGVYWGRIDQNTVARMFRAGGQWRRLKQFSDPDDPLIDPPFKIFMEHWRTPVPDPVYSYQPVTFGPGDFDMVIDENEDLPTQAPAPPNIVDRGTQPIDRTPLPTQAEVLAMQQIVNGQPAPF